MSTLSIIIIISSVSLLRAALEIQEKRTPQHEMKDRRQHRKTTAIIEEIDIYDKNSNDFDNPYHLV